MHTTSRVVATGLLTLYALAAHAAAPVAVNGDLASQNDVIRVGFHLDADTLDVKLWTDSFKGGLNFDPQIALWSASSGALIDRNDDNPFVHTGQTLYDAGLWLDSLVAGDYLVTLTLTGNDPVGAMLSDGFKFDTMAAAPLTGTGSHYALNFENADRVTPMTSPVPEPTPLALLAAGLGVLAWVGRRPRPAFAAARRSGLARLDA